MIKIRKLLQKFKKLNILLTTSCLLIVATGSAELFQATPSGALEPTPSTKAIVTPSTTSEQTAEADKSVGTAVLEKDLFERNAKWETDVTGDKFKGLVSVKFKDEATESARVGALKLVKAKIQRTSKYFGIRTLRVKEGEEESTVEQLLRDPNVEIAYIPTVTKQSGFFGGGGLGYSGASCGEPNDTYFCSGQQPNLSQAGATSGWGMNKGSSSIIIAVLDTGVKWNHTDLDSKIWTNPGETYGDNTDGDGNGIVDDEHGWNAFIGEQYPEAGNTNDENGHGTFVAGIASAETNNGSGIAGINWHAKIMPVKVLDSGGGGTSVEVIADGIIYAADEGADVINMSIIAPDWTNYEKQIAQDAVNYARSLNVVLIAAVMNSATQNCFMGFPAALDGVISVSALNAQGNGVGGCTGNVKNGTPYQPLDTSAPGTNIYSTKISTTNNGLVGQSTGTFTSFATPHVSGIAAILLGCNSNDDSAINVLTHHGIDYGPVGWDNKFGFSTAFLFYQVDEQCYGGQF